MALLFIILILFAVASFGYGMYYLIMSVVKRERGNLKLGVIYLGLGIISIGLLFYVAIGDFADSFNN